jgi:hypothetical protein
MKRQWTIKRQLKEVPDGQNRWNQAYQLLLKAESLSERGTAGTVPLIPQPQENADESCTVRSGFNAPTGSDAEY